ncbi:hypothetical protein VTK56DRAFT_1349 [Thermocarpiscus australiensis]
MANQGAVPTAHVTEPALHGDSEDSRLNPAGVDDTNTEYDEDYVELPPSAMLAQHNPSWQAAPPADNAGDDDAGYEIIQEPASVPTPPRSSKQVHQQKSKQRPKASSSHSSKSRPPPVDGSATSTAKKRKSSSRAAGVKAGRGYETVQAAEPPSILEQSASSQTALTGPAVGVRTE